MTPRPSVQGIRRRHSRADRCNRAGRSSAAAPASASTAAPVPAATSAARLPVSDSAARRHRSAGQLRRRISRERRFSIPSARSPGSQVARRSGRRLPRCATSHGSPSPRPTPAERRSTCPSSDALFAGPQSATRAELVLRGRPLSGRVGVVRRDRWVALPAGRPDLRLSLGARIRSPPPALTTLRFSSAQVVSTPRTCSGGWRRSACRLLTGSRSATCTGFTRSSRRGARAPPPRVPGRSQHGLHLRVAALGRSADAASGSSGDAPRARRSRDPAGRSPLLIADFAPKAHSTPARRLEAHRGQPSPSRSASPPGPRRTPPRSRATRGRRGSAPRRGPPPRASSTSASRVSSLRRKHISPSRSARR